MQLLTKMIPLFLFLFSSTISTIYSGENIAPSNMGTLPEQIQDSIIRTVNKLQPALVRIHVIEKYYSEGRELK
ncbi:MAG: hypothetical protein ACP5KS_14725, partial [Candidatus Hydrogenedens sp.]